MEDLLVGSQTGIVVLMGAGVPRPGFQTGGFKAQEAVGLSVSS